ncbi:MAG: hypothetical protein DRP91_04095, partial [Candidatus Neomarinimicrobiota bacterium]
MLFGRRRFFNAFYKAVFLSVLVRAGKKLKAKKIYPDIVFIKILRASAPVRQARVTKTPAIKTPKMFAIRNFLKLRPIKKEASAPV